MKEVKGTIFVTIVKSIKANPNSRGKYDDILSDKAKELLNQRILVATWYPLEQYREIYDAICLFEGKNDPKILHQWGRDEANRWFTTVYKFSVIEGDLKLATEKYSRFHRMVHNYGEILSEFLSDNELVFTYKDIPRDWKNWYLIAAGYANRFIELCINKKVNFFFLNKSWINNKWTKLKLSWII
ncbi:MAG: hypothetical protein ACFFC3_06270 [Candidatus Odinarchaeota archaeon]